MKSEIDPHVLEARRLKAEADAQFEKCLAEAQEKMMRHMIIQELERHMIIQELERRDGHTVEDL